MIKLAVMWAHGYGLPDPVVVFMFKTFSLRGI